MDKINEKLSAYIDENKDECEDMAIASNKAYIDELKAELELTKKAMSIMQEYIVETGYDEITIADWLAKAKEGK